MKIAVVGAGIFGITSAVYLSRAGHNPDLFEREPDIMMAASNVNQYRLHRGYHYPRSNETIESCIEGEPRFREEYGEAVISKNKHFYCIAKERTLSTTDQCFKIWDRWGLKYERAHLDIIDERKIDSCVRVKESLIDPKKWKKICKERLKKYKIRLMLGKEFRESDFGRYDKVIIATYANNNSLLNSRPEKMRDYQFELVEKPLLRLPKKYSGKSVVIIDGPFTCLEPYGGTGLFLMGNVVQAIHARNIGKLPDVPKEYLSFINKGLIRNPPTTHIKSFLDESEEFFPGISRKAEHVGSMFTIRTVLPYREHDDSRPTIVEKINDKIITIFSGKIPVCVNVAEDIVRLIGKNRK